MKKRAVIAGIDNYRIFDPSGKTDLSGCVHDARNINELLQDAFGFDEVYHYENHRASRDQILDALGHLISISEAGDTICFYFSGHGGRRRGKLSKVDCDYFYESLLTSTGELITDYDLTQLANPLYPDAVNFTLIIDACHSGGLHTADQELKCKAPVFDEELLLAIEASMATVIPFGLCISDNFEDILGNVSNVKVGPNGSIDLDPDPTKTFLPAAKSTLLAACNFNELSWISSKEKGSIFTNCLLEVINQSGYAGSYTDLFEELQEKMEDKITRYIRPNQPGTQQTAQLFGQRNRMKEAFLAGYTYSPMDV